MIDLGISKLALIGVVALVVIGPEKLPKVARMAGTLFGRAQRYVNEVKAEVSREFEMDELRKMQKDMQDAARDVEENIAGNLRETQQELQSVWNDPAHANASVDHSLPYTVGTQQLALKAKNFRRKKLARTSALPAWYKNQNGQRSHVISGAARVAKYRPKTRSNASFF